MFAGKKSAQIREILISESAWEEMTCLFAPSLSELTADWEHPLCWWRLAKEAGANEEKHAAISERYGM
ncbi:hypothetical protein [Escherichia sp.]